MRFDSIASISILKTLYFNYKYCVKLSDSNTKLKDFMQLPFVLSRNVKLKKMGGKISFTKGCHVSIGFGEISIFDKNIERAVWNNSGNVIFLGNAHIGHGSRINNHGSLTFGDNFGISANSTIDCDCEIQFGENVLLSWDILIMDHDVHKIFDTGSGRLLNEDEAIRIGDNVWIGCRCTILKGTAIADNCVVAAGSMLSKPVSEENVIIGNSGKILKSSIRWERYM